MESKYDDVADEINFDVDGPSPIIEIREDRRRSITFEKFTDEQEQVEFNYDSHAQIKPCIANV